MVKVVLWTAVLPPPYSVQTIIQLSYFGSIVYAPPSKITWIRLLEPLVAEQHFALFEVIRSTIFTSSSKQLSDLMGK